MDRILYGAAYYDEYMPCDRLQEDIELMKKAGMNLVRIGESTWSTFEPRDGEFYFDSLIRVLEATKAAGIYVILGTPTYAVPSWMVGAHPDILATTVKGRGIYGARQIMDITNPTYLFYAERAIRKMMERCAGYDNVIGVQIDNETKAYGTAGPNVQQGFAVYLHDKFTSLIHNNPGLLEAIPAHMRGISEDPGLDYLNYEFGFDYWSNRINSWREIPDVRGTINASFSGEFKKYQRKLVTDFLGWQAGIVREYLREDQFITHNTDFNWIGYSYGINGETDACDNGQVMDKVGVDIYHHSQDALTGMEIAFGGDVSRSLKQDNYYVLETAAQGFPSWLPFEGQLRLQAYSHLASGADMVEYWHWHTLHNSFETYWKGILSQDFKENDTYRAVSMVGRELQRIGDRLMHLKKKNRVAILVSQESLSAIEAFPIDGKNLSYNDILMKIYDALYRMNVECDFLWPAQRDRMKNYDLVVIPALYCVSQETLDAIDAYVRGGGHVFVTFKCGFSDEHVKVWHDASPHGFDKICGISYSHFSWVEEVPLKTEREEAALACDFIELLNPEGAEILASYDHSAWGKYAAATRKGYGKGIATYLGCMVDDAFLTRLLGDSLSLAGIRSDHKVCFPLIHREGTNSHGKEIHYYLNYSGQGQPLSIPYDGRDILTDKQLRAGSDYMIPPWDLLIMELEV